jgi:hypothetical protein
LFPAELAAMLRGSESSLARNTLKLIVTVSGGRRRHGIFGSIAR